MLASIVAVAVVAQAGDVLLDVDFAKPATIEWRPISGTWKVEVGEYRQLESGYDLVSVADRRIDGAFTMAVDVRAMGGVRGAGLQFGLPSRGSIAGSTMLRFDPDGFLFGEFDRNSTFRPTKTQSLRGGEFRTLKVAVDPSVCRCNLWVDGLRLATDVPTGTCDGFVALHSSGGGQAFRSVRVARATSDDLAGIRRDRLLIAPSGIACRAPDHWIVADRGTPHLLEFDRDGKLVRRFGDASIARPGRLAIASDGTMALADGCEDHVVLLDADGKKIGEIGKGAIQWPAAIAFDAKGRLAVADAMANRVVLFDRAGKMLATVGNKGSAAGEFDGASGVAFDARGRLVVTETDNLRYQMFDEMSGAWRLVDTGPWMSRPIDVAIAPNGDVLTLGGLGYYEDGGCVRRLRSDGYPMAHFAAFAVGGLSTTGQIAVAPDGTIAVTDSTHDRIVFVPMDLAEPRPIVTPQHAGLEITWSPAMRGEPRLAADAGRVERMRIMDLAPMQPVTFRIAPTIRTIPAEEWSKTYHAVAPPPHGKTALLHFEVLVAIYLQSERDGEPTFVLARDKLGDKVEREFEKARRFYLRNSGFKLDVAFTFVVVDGPVAHVKGGWLEPEDARRDVAPLLEKQGKKLADFDSLVATWAEPGYDASVDDDSGAVGGGGLTPFAYSCFGMGGKLAWLFCHEFHHQLDAFFDKSGYPEYWLNHPDATVHPGRYGQHWDCNAFILRNWPRADWLACAFGHPMLVDDADQDGVPDRDSRLALDEVRIGLDPTSWDTDHDGFSDLAAATTGTFDDPWTLRPTTTDIPSGHYTWLGPLKGPRFDGDVGIRWDEDELRIEVRGGRPFQLEVQQDGMDDGWFTIGDRDNTEWRATSTRDRTKHVACVRIPRDERRGPRLVDGARQGIAIRIVTGNHDTWVFDPWALWSFRTVAR
ncbi:MAG: NHL repeat-containing protein [Planctomycetes bacterium]|nr:NHL repeat-containing protein [Planctomycetota bacterium]